MCVCAPHFKFDKRTSPIRRPASLSRDLQSRDDMPALIHSLHEENSSVLSLAASDDLIFSGGQNCHISVWCRKTFQLVRTLREHTGSVLALEYASERDWLFSASGDSTVCVWSTKTLALLYVLHPYQETGSGDLFSLAWSPSLGTLYIGCQDTSLQWFDFRGLQSVVDSAPGSGTNTPNTRKPHRFFDSYPQHERRPADLFANNSASTALNSIHFERTEAGQVNKLQVPATNVIDSAHYGYLYCMAILEGDNSSSEGIQLVTGSGDETVKLWAISSTSSPLPQLVHTFTFQHGAVLAIAARGETIYAGCQDGYVKVLDVETRACVRTIIVDEGVDILSVSLLGSDLYTFSAGGRIQRWSASFDCTASWKGHEGIILSSKISHPSSQLWTNATEDLDMDLTIDSFQLITGGNDNYIKIWDVVPPKTRNPSRHAITSKSTIEYALSKFVAFQSVSSLPKHSEDCRQAAIWLKKCLAQLGAQSTLLPTREGANPLVLGTFSGTSKPGVRKQRILFYGHYDVISAPPHGWNSDPWTLSGRNGYLYGRGVTDDKGPIMAVACAAAELLSKRSLGVDLVFLIEGEEECGSIGFGDAVKRHKEQIGHIDAIFVSNSTWIAESPPCITYGLRGVVHCTLQISSNMPDLHSGIEGGAVVEPMLDMVRLLATLTDNTNRVQIPGFYDSVRPQTEEEHQLYLTLSPLTQRPASTIASRWCEPSLTIHNIQISGPRNATVIPGSVKAQISLRIVPDQDLNTIVKSLCDHLHASFANFNSPNEIQVSIDHIADWWLGDLDGPWFKSLEKAVRDEWGVEPLRIREGGSIPSIPYLEKEFKCRALHLPMGQSTDQAHLPNERISLQNLQRGKAVVERFLLNVSEMPTASE
ncbi:hypothetical protein EYR36_000477 [Pleurotus pulmonarius]|nr:hypothetical protein EYR36_000477 [Pleurotus pulmonarius]